MLIILTHLPAEGLGFTHQYETGELDLSHHEFTFRQVPEVQGRVTQIGQEIRVKGSLHAELDVACDRCLESVILPVQREFDLFYWPVSTTEGEEKELHERDLDVSFYRNDQLDLDELVLEQLELSLPIRILCREGCQGLCQQCGTNLNEEPCHCQPPMDPRWEAIADLKK